MKTNKSTNHTKSGDVETVAGRKPSTNIFKKQNQFVTLLILLAAWPGANSAQAASPGSVVAWGATGPVPVEAQSGVTVIAAGSSHTVALKTNGAVVAWGNNSSGQATVPVAAQSGVIAIAAGSGHTVALKANGTNIVGATNDSLTISNVQPVNVGYYNVSVSDTVGSVSSARASLSLFAPTISTYELLGTGQLRLQFDGPAGSSYTVLVSTNLIDWTPLGPATEATPGHFEFTDADAAGQPTRFYRLRSP